MTPARALILLGIVLVAATFWALRPPAGAEPIGTEPAVLDSPASDPTPVASQPPAEWPGSVVSRPFDASTGARRVHARIVDPESRPIPTAVVDGGVARAAADAAGCVVFGAPDETVSLSVRAPGFVSREIECTADATDLGIIRLERCRLVVRGRVVAPGGEGLGSANVEIGATSGPPVTDRLEFARGVLDAGEGFVVLARARADAEGRFRVEIDRELRDLVVSAVADTACGVAPVVVPPGAVGVSVVVHTTGGATLRGTVVDAHGSGVAGARIAAFVNDDASEQALLVAATSLKRTVTTADGRFEVPAVPARRLAVAVASSIPGGPLAVFDVQPPFAEPLRLVVPGGGGVRGRVTDRVRGTPVPGARVCFMGGEGGAARLSSATSDRDGNFVAAGVDPAVPLMVSVRAEGYARASSTADATLYAAVAAMSRMPSSAARLEVVLSPGASLEGTVFERAAVPAIGAVLRVAQGTEVRELTTSESGTFVARDLAPGPVELAVRHAGFALRPEERYVHLEPGQPKRVVLELRPTLTASGRVVDPAGAGVEDAVVGLRGADGTPVVTPTDAEGRFRFTDCAPAEELVLEVDHPAYARREVVETHRAEAPEHDFGDVVLVRGASIEGRIVASDGAAGRGLSLRFSPNPGTWAVSAPVGRTDHDGRFRLAGLPEGPGWVFVEGGRDPAARFAVETLTRAEVRGGLEWRMRKGKTLRVRVVDQDGRPATAAVVTASFSPPEGMARNPEVVSSGFGRVLLDRAPDGAFASAAVPDEVVCIVRAASTSSGVGTSIVPPGTQEVVVTLASPEITEGERHAR